jgi:hypothetical protein
MPRLMSVSMTVDAVRERRKTVTRRKGWRFLKAGDRLTLCEKVQGRKPGQPLVRLAEVEVVSVRRESLSALTTTDQRAILDDPNYGPREVAAEGFPGMDPREFVGRFFVKEQRMDSNSTVTRIEWRYLDDEAAA